MHPPPSRPHATAESSEAHTCLSRTYARYPLLLGGIADEDELVRAFRQALSLPQPRLRNNTHTWPLAPLGRTGRGSWYLCVLSRHELHVLVPSHPSTARCACQEPLRSVSSSGQTSPGQARARRAPGFMFNPTHACRACVGPSLGSRPLTRWQGCRASVLSHSPPTPTCRECGTTYHSHKEGTLDISMVVVCPQGKYLPPRERRHLRKHHASFDDVRCGGKYDMR